MKTFLKQYLLTWAKFLVMTPGLAFITLSGFITSLYTLFSAALLGDGKTFNEVMGDVIDRLQL
jgi:hypothetical protein